MALIQNVLTPSVVTGVISRIFTPGNPISRFFKMEIGGSNVLQVEGRAYSYDIFDHVRSIAKGRQPGTGPATNAVNPVGRQTNTMARSYEKWAMNYEMLNNIRTLGKNAGERDRAGASYLSAQGGQLKQKYDNFVEYLVGMAITVGKAYFQFSGEDMIPVQSLGANTGMTLDWLIPAGNNGLTGGAFAANLNPLATGNIITAAWSNTGTDISTQIDQINQAFQQLVGAPLALAITDSTVWRYVLKNTSLQAQGGSVNAVFAEYTMEEVRGPDGNKLGIQRGRLRAIPWLEWLVLDTGLEFNGTFARWFPGTQVTFSIEPNPAWFKRVEGSELVKDNPMAPAIPRFGFWSWLREWDEPARIELHALINTILELNLPKGLMFGQVA